MPSHREGVRAHSQLWEEVESCGGQGWPSVCALPNARRAEHVRYQGKPLSTRANHLTVACPTCRAKEGEPCVRVGTTRKATIEHVPRMHRYRAEERAKWYRTDSEGNMIMAAYALTRGMS